MDIIVRKNRQGRLGQVTTRIDSRLRYLPVEARDVKSATVEIPKDIFERVSALCVRLPEV